MKKMLAMTLVAIYKYPNQRHHRFYLWGNIYTQEIVTNLQKIYVQETTLQTHNTIYI